MPEEILWEVRVRGLVQGVGFRPMVWRVATRDGLRGEVLNDAEGVLIRLACTRLVLDQVLETMARELPPLSRVDSVEVSQFHGAFGANGFTIAPSKTGNAGTGIVPDSATCEDCLSDIRNPGNRRFGYAFTNCTNCGPRLSITRAIPYDRANTTMADFAMCLECQQEYDNPADRRFHAQPNACPSCGPQLVLVDSSATPVPGDPIAGVVDALRDGKIVAIKGLGGFQLACDATDDDAVEMLRTRKHRRAKPFALMGRDVKQVERYIQLSAATLAALKCPKSPIVLAPVLRDAPLLARGIAPGQNRLGFMLPNTPLHHLLLQKVGGPLVMTSGNPSGEPQIIENDEAVSRLTSIADCILLHDRNIVNRVDDTVVQIIDDAPYMLRRARGYAPEPLRLHRGFSEAIPVLATGADLKNTFCLLKDGQATVSQHMGDMENERTHRNFRANLKLFSDAHDFRPTSVAVDMHPEYFSSRIGREVSATQGAQLIEVQHHHAHVAAVLAEHGHGPDVPSVLGIVLDGLGHGTDRTIWGGEFLLANYRDFRRLAHLAPIPLAGGDKANQQPWRNTFAHLMTSIGPDPLAQIEGQYGELPILARLRGKPVDVLEQMISGGLNAPLASSAGRLFDAVAGALGICFDQIDIEGQAAMRLQALAEEAPDEVRDYNVEPGPVIGWKSLWRGILSDIRSGEPHSSVAARFHNSLIKVIVKQALRLSNEHGTSTIVLAGGVFQNALLLSGVMEGLVAHGRKVLVSRKYPSNDGGISLGQAAIAAAQTLEHAGE